MANIFTYDTHCKALWRFESGALETDSVGGNTLTNNGVTANTSVYIEGAAAAEFTNGDYMYITDANLDSGFPLKSTESNKKISVCGWFAHYTNYSGMIFTKYSASKRSFQISLDIHRLRLGIGYNSGASVQVATHATSLSYNTGYHFTVTYDDSDRSYSIRIKDLSGNTVGSDLTGNFDHNISLTDERVELGLYPGSSSQFIGFMDEIVVFDDIITAAEAIQIAQGTYHGGLSQLAVYYNAGTDESSSWYRPERVWDHSLFIYANQSLSAYGYSGYLLSTGIYTSDPGDIGTIVKVEVGAKYYDYLHTGTLRIYPYVGGSSSSYYATLQPHSVATTEYHDITNCTNAPDPWTWDDIVALDLRSRAHNNNASGSTFYIYEIWLRITYDVYVPPANEPIPEQLHYYKNGIVNINIYPTSSGIDNYMNITYSGTQVGYIPIVSGNGTGSNPTDLRVRIDSSTYTVQSER